RFGHQFADIIEGDGDTIGILISYPGRMLGRLSLTTGRQLWGIHGAIGFIRFARRALPLAFVKEADADEFFINALAVSPAFQGRGIGSQLLSYAEPKARSQHYNKCSLSVARSNLRACHLYERGYRVVETIPCDLPGYAGYHPMVKVL
ncbi:MAG TPA: GNAT family N-acetyltransferase, partial [Anaerolineales bacterium]|nr:GNAT family N-acetyltransferase [Anaerolineales bacterium]